MNFRHADIHYNVGLFLVLTILVVTLIVSMAIESTYTMQSTNYRVNKEIMADLAQRVFCYLRPSNRKLR
ncbi:hypothetical protein GCM10009111_21100 [Colwellia asteriadis]|uniref:Uncharacterized protein n=1 Tax=Colwellia asteriadis TaxID=517723 RepID=A0ABP3WGZ3_9GAMM